MFSNSEILAAVVTKWVMPMCAQIMSTNINKIPFLDNLQSKVKSTGWVSDGWRISNELVPFAEPIARAMIMPPIKTALSGLSDEDIPVFAHGVVDKAIRDGGLCILDGNIRFDTNDLNTLKRLLNANLPIADNCLTYQVKEE